MTFNSGEAPGNPKEPLSSPQDDIQQDPGGNNDDDVGPQQQCAATASGDVAEDVRARKKLKSPTTSIDAGDRNRSPSPARRTKGKYSIPAKEVTSDSVARPTTKGRLWREGDPPITTRAAAAPPQPTSRTSRRQTNKSIGQEVEQEDPSVTHMIKQPETRPISQEQLVAEVKGIYAGLVMYAYLTTRILILSRILTPNGEGSNPSVLKSIVPKASRTRVAPSSAPSNGKPSLPCIEPCFMNITTSFLRLNTRLRALRFAGWPASMRCLPGCGDTVYTHSWNCSGIVYRPL